MKLGSSLVKKAFYPIIRNSDQRKKFHFFNQELEFPWKKDYFLAINRAFFYADVRILAKK
jgi:hypothetical protein